jgi:hypothetical protein
MNVCCCNCYHGNAVIGFWALLDNTYDYVCVLLQSVRHLNMQFTSYNILGNSYVLSYYFTCSERFSQGLNLSIPNAVSLGHILLWLGGNTHMERNNRDVTRDKTVHSVALI